MADSTSAPDPPCPTDARPAASGPDCVAEDDHGLLLADARRGDAGAWGALLSAYRPYLTLLAEVHLGRKLRVKADPADLVQEAYLQAHRAFGDFRGTTAAEFLAWLRRLLASRLDKLVRRYCGTGARDLRVEQALADSSAALDAALADPGSSPSARAARGDDAVRVAAALERLPADQRRVIVLRQLEGLPFACVGELMGRTEAAATQLWARALKTLRGELGAP
ncbi:MAG: sigma-70 family RNA polymerase sigma factor [Gemmataceae bacterium]